MPDSTTILFGLPGVAVRDVAVDARNVHIVHVVTDEAAAAACPDCGVFSTSVRQYRSTRPKDLPYGEAPLQVRWRKGAVPVSGAKLSPQGLHRVDRRGTARGPPGSPVGWGARPPA